MALRSFRSFIPLRFRWLSSQDYDLSALRFLHQFVGAAVPSDHLDTEMMNSVIGSGEY
jgi:hypothetical protein